jgi:hypothetical protein
MEANGIMGQLRTEIYGSDNKMLSLGLCEPTFGERDTRCTRRQKCHWRHLRLNAVELDCIRRIGKGKNGRDLNVLHDNEDSASQWD